MIEHTLARLARVGVQDVTLALGFRPDDFLAAYPQGEIHGVNLHYSIEPEPLDTGGAIAYAAADSNIDDTFIVCNGDIIDGAELDLLLKDHLGGTQLATIELTTVDDPSRFGVVDCDPQGRVRCFVEKPAPEAEPSNHINAGTYVMEPAALAGIKPGERRSVERDIFPALAQNQALQACLFDQYWLDAGKPDSCRQANRDMGHTSDAVHPDAAIGVHTQIVGSTIGASSIVGAGASVFNSVLLEGCLIGAHARVINCISVRQLGVLRVYKWRCHTLGAQWCL
jgi:mannose-1-phosphate guanylyltransferase